ncbi:hypothetical protein FE236_01225 [Mariprofundus erugo]|nr:hypothetical protein FE236_01225 [Mariprofundus erugo]
MTRYLNYLKRMQRVNMSLARGAASAAVRRIDLTRPETWEFSGFSQNGEDGIIDVLLSQLTESNRYFIEIGAADGLENNTTWLAMVKRFGGQWIEGGEDSSQWCRYIFGSLNYGVECVSEFITQESIQPLKERSLYNNPDLFSLDIDSNDYFIVDSILASGMRPKIFVVEYNAVYGPEKVISVPYDTSFFVKPSSPDNLYYGCSIAAMKKVFDKHGYKFVCVDCNGVNAFFVDPIMFDSAFLENIVGVEYRENFSNAREYKLPWDEQFKLIENRKFHYPE